ncbi:hypothetical protein Xoosp13_371 [Xanthomonas phage Xoo-sp13]|nr:hypothetical protein Xoosp13_371 [Xanthomonas phage Xoo-sp13]
MCNTIPTVVQNSHELYLVQKYYDTQTAKRSGVPLINHIHEGISVMDYLGASINAMKAYALHPLLQTDESLLENYENLLYDEQVDPICVVLCVEYRNIANQYLSRRKIGSLDDIKLSPLPDVNDMLRGDKAQNYKDFLIYHKGTHERSTELDLYFKNWITKLECWKAFYELMPIQYHGKVHEK